MNGYSAGTPLVGQILFIQLISGSEGRGAHCTKQSCGRNAVLAFDFGGKGQCPGAQLRLRPLRQ